MNENSIKSLKRGDIILTKWGHKNYIEQDIFQRIEFEKGKIKIKTKYWNNGWLLPEEIIMILDLLNE